MSENRSYYERVAEILVRRGTNIPEPVRSTKAKARLRLGAVIRAVSVLLLVATTISYVCDSLVLRHRMCAHQTPFAVVNVARFYAVPEKGGRTEFMYEGTEPQTCVRALFPHYGYPPCWYAERNRQRRENP